MKPPRKSQISVGKVNRADRGSIISYLQKNRGKQQYRPAPNAGLAVNRIMRPLSKKFGPGANALKSQWPQIVGDKWARLSRPVAIRGSKDGRTLVVEAQGPAASLIQANSGQLLDKINQFLGDKAISKLRVVQGSIQKREKLRDDTLKKDIELQSTLENDEGDELQLALNRLGKKISTQKTK